MSFLFQECPIGPEANLLDPSANQCRRLVLESPLLSHADLQVLKESSLPEWKVNQVIIN